MNFGASQDGSRAFFSSISPSSLLLFHPSHLLAADLPQVPPLQLQSFEDAAPKLVFFTKGFFIAQIEAQTLCCTYRSGDNVSVTPRLHILLFQEGFILLGKESNGSCQVRSLQGGERAVRTAGTRGWQHRGSSAHGASLQLWRLGREFLWNQRGFNASPSARVMSPAGHRGFVG